MPPRRIVKARRATSKESAAAKNQDSQQIDQDESTTTKDIVSGRSIETLIQYMELSDGRLLEINCVEETGIVNFLNRHMQRRYWKPFVAPEFPNLIQFHLRQTPEHIYALLDSSNGDSHDLPPEYLACYWVNSKVAMAHQNSRTEKLFPLSMPRQVTISWEHLCVILFAETLQDAADAAMEIARLSDPTNSQLLLQSCRDQVFPLERDDQFREFLKLRVNAGTSFSGKFTENQSAILAEIDLAPFSKNHTWDFVGWEFVDGGQQFLSNFAARRNRDGDIKKLIFDFFNPPGLPFSDEAWRSFMITIQQEDHAKLRNRLWLQLDFDHNLSDEVFDMMVHTRLGKLMLHESYPAHNHGDSLMNALSQGLGPRELEIEGYGFRHPQKNIDVLRAMENPNCALECFRMGRKYLSFTGATAALIHMLQRNTSLTSLRIPAIISNDHIKSVLDAIAGHPTLRSLQWEPTIFDFVSGTGSDTPVEGAANAWKEQAISHLATVLQQSDVTLLEEISPSLRFTAKEEKARLLWESSVVPILGCRAIQAVEDVRLRSTLMTMAMTKLATDNKTDLLWKLLRNNHGMILEWFDSAREVQ